jgi:hypothetical protein
MCIASMRDPGIHHKGRDYHDSSNDQDSDDRQQEADVKCTHGSNPFFPGSQGRVQVAMYRMVNRCAVRVGRQKVSP